MWGLASSAFSAIDDDEFQNDQSFIRASKARHEWVRVLDLDCFSD